jgi:hypothetical protein
MWKGCQRKEKLHQFINASRPIGTLKNRWEDDVRKDLQTMKVNNWKKSILNRDLWKTTAE